MKTPQVVEKSPELQLMEAQNAAQFAMSPVGQMVKEFEAKQRIANMFAQSDLVPDTYKGKIGNCVIALDMAMRMNVNPLAVMQNMYIVYGNPSWSSQFLISCINHCGRFSPLRYECNSATGEALAWRAYAYDKEDVEKKEPLFGTWISMKMANDEGWTKKAGSKWKTMPDQMMKYRAAAFWQRTFAPEISMGFLTKEEAEDIGENNPQPQKPKSKFAQVASQALHIDETIDEETGEIIQKKNEKNAPKTDLFNE